MEDYPAKSDYFVQGEKTVFRQALFRINDNLEIGNCDLPSTFIHAEVNLDVKPIARGICPWIPSLPRTWKRTLGMPWS
jgi:hypothetical protein